MGTSHANGERNFQECLTDSRFYRAATRAGLKVETT